MLHARAEIRESDLVLPTSSSALVILLLWLCA